MAATLAIENPLRFYMRIYQDIVNAKLLSHYLGIF